jgi:hypothetical protein
MHEQRSLPLLATPFCSDILPIVARTGRRVSPGLSAVGKFRPMIGMQPFCGEFAVICATRLWFCESWESKALED